MIKEEWKCIKDYPDYDISNTGTIRSRRRAKCRYLTPRSMKGGYERIHLCNDSEEKDFLIHRLVLDAFTGPAPNGCEANHKDGVTWNNNINNLEWISHSDNVKHGYRNGNPSRSGELNARALLTNAEANQIRKMYNQGIYKATLSLIFNVREEIIQKIIIGKTYKC